VLRESLSASRDFRRGRGVLPANPPQIGLPCRVTFASVRPSTEHFRSVEQMFDRLPRPRLHAFAMRHVVSLSLSLSLSRTFITLLSFSFFLSRRRNGGSCCRVLESGFMIQETQCNSSSPFTVDLADTRRTHEESGTFAHDVAYACIR